MSVCLNLSAFFRFFCFYCSSSIFHGVQPPMIRHVSLYVSVRTNVTDSMNIVTFLIELTIFFLTVSFYFDTMFVCFFVRWRFDVPREF